jgi:toxin ParE1/3/4
VGEEHSRLRYSERARSDLMQIIRYGRGEQWPDPVAYVQALRARIAVLAAHRDSGRTGRVAGTREWVLTGTAYIAVYRHKGTAIEVLRILHGAQIE